MSHYRDQLLTSPLLFLIIPFEVVVFFISFTFSTFTHSPELDPQKKVSAQYLVLLCQRHWPAYFYESSTLPLLNFLFCQVLFQYIFLSEHLGGSAEELKAFFRGRSSIFICRS